MRWTLAILGLATAFPAVAAPKLLPAPKGFETFSTDTTGGGWVIHHHLRGDTLWGCADVANVDRCVQIPFEWWMPTSSMEMLHVSEKTHEAWFKLSSKGIGDMLFACTDPEGETPTCTPVELGTAPKAMVKLERVWPDGQCDETCFTDPTSKEESRARVESKAYADMWLQLSVTGPGSSNLYACRNLASGPECVEAVPNWLLWDREPLGLAKGLKDIKNDDKTFGPGVEVSKVDEDSVADDAGFREGDVITSINGWKVDRAAKASAILGQFPAGATITITLDNGNEIQLTPRRKSED